MQGTCSNALITPRTCDICLGDVDAERSRHLPAWLPTLRHKPEDCQDTCHREHTRHLHVQTNN